MSNINADLKYLPAASLVHATNIRQTNSDKDDAEMKASILAQGGVQQNLIGAPRYDGKVAIFAGGRRLKNVHELIASGKLPADFAVPVMVRADIDPESTEAIEIALAENVVRSDMDYIDVCNAMLKLSSAGRSDEQIAAAFDFRPKTVREKLLIANIIPEAQNLVRSGERALEWARAMTIADKGMQARICDDIAQNPNAWVTGEEIRIYLTKATIEAEHALFDVADYDGVVVSDFFEGDKFADVEKFWDLQLQKIAELQAELETKNYGRGVFVTREPFQDWRYEETTNPAEAMAIIEISPNGKVRTITGMKPTEHNIANGQGAVLEDGQTFSEAETRDDDIAGFEVRNTHRIAEYAMSFRTAMLQQAFVGNLRASLEYTCLAFLGNRSAMFSVTPVALNTKDHVTGGEALRSSFEVASEINDLTNASLEVTDHEYREQMQLAAVRSMTEDQLQRLFTLLVSQRVGQRKRTGIDDNPNALSNIFGADIDVRSFWMPDSKFFGLMSTEDLRRLCANLIPGVSPLRFASTKRKDLIEVLDRVFEDAQSGAIAAGPSRMLNNWIPGVMSFPAKIVTEADSINANDTDDDLESSIFGFEDEAA